MKRFSDYGQKRSKSHGAGQPECEWVQPTQCATSLWNINILGTESSGDTAQNLFSFEASRKTFSGVKEWWQLWLSV